jgi:hypothetical protein
MTPFLALVVELPIFVPDTLITQISTVMLGVQVPLLALARTIKIRSMRAWALGIGFIGIFLSANAYLYATMQTGFKILSTDLATLDFKTSLIVFALAVAFNALGQILEIRDNERSNDTE